MFVLCCNFNTNILIIGICQIKNPTYFCVPVKKKKKKKSYYFFLFQFFFLLWQDIKNVATVLLLSIKLLLLLRNYLFFATLHVICLWNPKSQQPIQDILLAYPNVCAEQPAHASAFCHKHSKIVQELGYPSELRPFLEKCGANPNAYTKDGKAKVAAILDKLSLENTAEENTESAEDAQGIRYFLRNKQLANKENFMLSEDAEEDCRKDLGEVQRLHRRSRGVECVVGGGGVIEYWAPLYKSEGPTQVASSSLTTSG